MLLWVNLHGGFVLGFALLGLYLLSGAIRYFRSRDVETRQNIASRLRELGMVTVVSLLASLINPYGYELHVHVYRYLSSRWLMNHIDEFLSPNFHGVAQQCFVAILLITIVGLAMSRNKPSLSRVLVLLFATYSGLYASRSLPVSSLLLTLIVAPLWTQALAEARDNPRSLAPPARFAFAMAVAYFTGGAARTRFPRPSLANRRCRFRTVGMCAGGEARVPSLDGCALRRPDTFRYRPAT